MLNKENINDLRKEVENQLSEIGNRRGIKLKIGTISYSPERFTCRLTGEPESGKKNEFQKYAELFGLGREDYGRTFSLDGDEYSITGLITSRSKYPVQCTRADGKMFKFTVPSIKKALGQNI
ncbi:MAG TPA: hypothetical protein PKO34_01005 [Smithellaceae bacterium]|nr:hypothetical protein [Smithellaceae bacterium]